MAPNTVKYHPDLANLISSSGSLCPKGPLFDDLGRPRRVEKRAAGDGAKKFSLAHPPFVHLPAPTTMYVELPIVSIVCALLVLLPLPWHWRARTVPTISMALWLFVYNIIAAVNSIVWANNAIIRIPVWCDIGMFLSSSVVHLPSSY